jgi:hypothetical protein
VSFHAHDRATATSGDSGVEVRGLDHDLDFGAHGRSQAGVKEHTGGANIAQHADVFAAALAHNHRQNCDTAPRYALRAVPANRAATAGYQLILYEGCHGYCSSPIDAVEQ